MRISDYKFPIFVGIIIFIIGICIFANSLKGEFLWDDHPLVESNLNIRSWQNIFKIFSGTLGQGGDIEFSYYRPFTEISYLIDYQTWRLNPVGYHLTNILLHCLISFFVFYLALMLRMSNFSAIAASLLFLVNPVHSEAVCSIAGRAELLATLFVLFYFCRFLNFGHRRCGLGDMIVFFVIAICGFLSKESFVVILPLLLLYGYLHKKKFFAFCLPALVALFVYLSLRIFLLPNTSSLIHNLSGAVARIPGFFSALIQYLVLLIVPINLGSDYGQPMLSFFDPLSLMGLVLLASIFGFIVKFRKSKPNLCFFILWFLVALLPSSNLYKIFSYIMLHYIYLPSIGFFLGVGMLCQAIFSNNKRNKWIFLSIILIGYSSATVIQNRYWQNPIEFHIHSLMLNPQSVTNHINLGIELEKRGHYDEAIDSYEKAIELKPFRTSAYYNLGLLYIKIGKNDSAIEVLNIARRLKPASVQVLNGLAIANHKLDNTSEAISLLNNAIKIDPDFIGSYVNLGQIFKEINEPNEARKIFSKVKELDPLSAQIHHNF